MFGLLIDNMSTKETADIYLSVYIRLYQDIANCFDVSCDIQNAEIQWISSRFERFGLRFFTELLPELGRELDKSLHNPSITPLWDEGVFGRQNKLLALVVGEPEVFEWREESFPRFLSWLWRRCHTFTIGAVSNTTYDRLSIDCQDNLRGELLNEDIVLRTGERVFKGSTLWWWCDDPYAILCLRQLTQVMYKLAVPYPEELNEKIINSFVNVESDLLKLEFAEHTKPILRFARGLVARVLGSIDPREILPRHGPGAVATGEQGGEKSVFRRIYSSLEREYPFTEYFCLGLNQIADTVDAIKQLEVLDSGTAKVVLVPKDSRGPRLISCEPLELQWIQQGLQKAMYSRIERHPLTRGRVNFTDQTVNRDLARSGSVAGETVTLDMKDASDRVSLKLVRELFSGTRLLAGLEASRSDATRLPNGVVQKLLKFAPMGSAVCFPVEAICFWALAFSILRLHGRTFQHCRKSIHVYGDDLVVERGDANLLLRYFPDFGLMFNERKCCLHGFFRESCGMDAYMGWDITPIRIRVPWSEPDGNVHAAISYVALSNALYRNCWNRSAEYLRLRIERSPKFGMLPYTNLEEEIPLTKFTWGDAYAKNKHNGLRSRYNKRLQRLEWCVLRPTPVVRKYPHYGWNECLRSLCCGSSNLPVGMYALARRIRLARAWEWLG